MKTITYNLRNQNKIINAYDKNILDRILISLNVHFNNNHNIELFHVEGEIYPQFSINDCGHTCALIIFYLLKFENNTYYLAYKEFFG